jgi:hypothetical protein
VRHVNRIRGLLCLQGVRHIDPGRREVVSLVMV